MITKIAWFKNYEFIERERIIDKATIRAYEVDEQIFRQGAPSPRFFIIIRGSVRACVTKVDMNNSFTITLPSFFDGQIFGEMSDYESQKDNISSRMLRELQMQKYSAYAQERSYILSIDKKDLHHIIESVRKQSPVDHMKSDLEFIRKIDIFKGISLFSLLPICNNLIRRTYKLGQQILVAGQVPQGLYII